MLAGPRLRTCSGIETLAAFLSHSGSAGCRWSPAPLHHHVGTAAPTCFASGGEADHGAYSLFVAI